MRDRSLRIVKERWLTPVARACRGLDPGHVTVGGFALGLMACAAALIGHDFWALALWLGNRFCDGLDGCLARVHRRQSAWGGYLDMLLDMGIYALLPLALAAAHCSPATWIALALLLASFYVNAGSWMYLSALFPDPEKLTSVAMPDGLIEGAETVIFFCLFLLLPRHLPLLFSAMAALVGVTVIQRMAWAARNLPRAYPDQVS